MMLQMENPEDFVIATGRTESVRKFIELSANSLGWNKNNKSKSIIWEGSGIHEIGRRSDNGEIVIRVDPEYFRPSEVDLLKGDPQKAKEKLGWEPKIKLEQIISEMIEEDQLLAKKEIVYKRATK